MENKQDKGFTLVELLIVIVILGILATVTVFAVRGITDRGQENSCAVERKTILTAVEAFYAENRTEPTFADLENGAYVNDSAATLSATWTLVPASVDASGNITAPANVTANVAPAKCAGFTP
jgi:prepilin-type N-terminal cleavage/methylation domain-containing protein